MPSEKMKRMNMKKQNYNIDSHREVRESFQNLQSWMEESQREFSNISVGLNKGIRDLIEEVSDLRTQLSVTTKERDDLIHSVGNLRGEIRQLRANAFMMLSKPVDMHYQDTDTEEANLKMEVADTNQQDAARSKKSDAVEEEPIFNDDVSTDPLNVSSFDDVNPSEDQICLECNFPFTTSENLMIHLKNIHSKLEMSEASSAGNDQINHNKSNKKIRGKRFKCKQCEYTSAHSGNVKQHIKVVHKKCGFTASEKSDLKVHIEAAHEKFKHVCEDCGYAAPKKQTLQRHIKAVHEKVKNHVCGHCGYAASLKGNLKVHIKAVHKNIKEHVCGDCGYAASQKSHLKTHIKAVHENIKNHVCGECGYAASQKRDLKKHSEAVHENNRRERNTHAILHTQSSINSIMALMIEGDIEGGRPSMKSMIDIIIPTLVTALVTAKLAALVGMGRLH